MARSPVTVEEHVRGVLDGSRAAIARAVTLVESTRPDHRRVAQQVLTELLPHTGKAIRIGITGVPGVGKSTFIDTFGTMLTSLGHGVAVLAVDPSSSRTGGSILGDKTRMHRLAVDPAAFIRPSPSSGTLGGVARATRESMVIMEAAGYDAVLVETVGVGQSEIAVAGMVDTFLLLALARTGDQLQGIKKGVLELADVIAVNKADGPHERDARAAARELAAALRLLRDPGAAWRTPVLTCSAQENTGLDEVWERIQRHRAMLESTGELDRRRRDQQVGWTWNLVHDQLLARLHEDPRVREIAPALEEGVRDGSVTATTAADQILGAFGLDASGTADGRSELPGFREREALLGFFVEVVGQRALLRDGDVAGQVARVGRADDRGRQAGVAEREAQDELHVAHARLSQQAGDAGGFPVPLADARVLGQGADAPVLVLRRGAAGRAAPDERARARAGRLGDELLVIALDRRVRDLEDVEDAHREVVGQVGQDAGHADVADLAFGLEVLERLDRLALFHGRLAR
jgi:LAO/AO transport system kinase